MRRATFALVATITTVFVLVTVASVAILSALIHAL
jgi:hypothetical protein